MHNKIVLSLLFLVFFFIPIISKAVTFDESVLKAAVQIQIWDISLNKYIGWGTGINIGSEFLTNHHVVEKVYLNPNRYRAYACVTRSINSDPECIIQLSPTKIFAGQSIGSAKYDKKVDLALFYLDKVLVNGVWQSWMNVSLNDMGINTINLAKYFKSYQDVFVGDKIYSIGYPDYGSGRTIQADGAVEKLIVNSNGQKLVLNNIDISHGNSGGPVFNTKGELVGVTDACLRASPDTDECKRYSGLFIPLPALNSWYLNITDSHIKTFEGRSVYAPNDGISDEVLNAAMCAYPLRQNAYYNSTKNECLCESGFSENSDGDCVDGSGYVDQSLRYGQKIDQAKERGAGVILGQSLSNLNQTSDQSLTPTKTNDQICQDNYGVKSNWDGTRDKEGKLNCGCQGGYIFNEQGTICVVKENNDQICQKDYGVNSVWDGSINGNGGPVCDCKGGYMFDEQKKSCIVSPIIPVKTHDQNCKNLYGENSMWNGIQNESNNYQCSCVEGYDWDSVRKNCISIQATSSSTTLSDPPLKVTPKIDFWAKLWSWFGF